MKLGCLAGVEYKGKIVFSPMYSNGLFELDTTTGMTRLIKIVKKELNVQALYRKAVLHNGEAWFIPQKGNNILKINLETYELQYLKVDYNVKFDTSGNYPYYYMFIDCSVILDKYLVCVPSGIDAVVIIDMDSNKMISVPNIANPNIDKVHTAFFTNENINIISEKGKLDKRINMADYSVEPADWEFDSSYFSSAIKFKDYLYLIPNRKDGELKLAKMNLMTKSIEYYQLPRTEDGYYGGVIWDKWLMMFPDNGARILRFDLHNSSFKFINYPVEIRKYITGDKTIVRLIDSNDKLFVSLCVEGFVLEFDKSGEITDYYDVIDMNDEERNKIFENDNRVNNEIFTKEGEPLSLADYIYMISLKEDMT